MGRPMLGIIGGSGLYDMPGLDRVQLHEVATPFGAPSDSLIEGWLGQTQLFFLPRHGRGHRFSPSEINYRANIWALKKMGVTDIVSVSAVGSMREDIVPGDLVIVDQFIDRTVSRPRTFFEQGCVAHVGFGDPVSKRVSLALILACERLGLRHHVGGTYVCIEGPQFSTRAESQTFRGWHNVAVVGMTNLPEARLAREAEIAYATLALATDYDCWHTDHDAVSVDQVIAVLLANVAKAQQVVRAVAEQPPEGADPADHALQHAIMTRPELISAAARTRLALFLDKYFPATA